MRPDYHPHSNAEAGSAILKRFNALAPLAPEENAFLLETILRTERHRAGSEIVAEDCSFEASRYLVSGWACRTRTLPDGRRQILDFYLPGDILGYCSRALTKTAAPYVALTTVDTASAAKLHKHLHENPSAGLKAACLQVERLQELFLLNQIVRAGRQAAYERVAHIFLEFFERLKLPQMTIGNSFPMPLTQEMLADGLGLSIVHVNRTVQQLKRDRLIQIGESVVTLPNLELLRSVADFKAVI